jgi:hypothetical protein
MNYKLARRIGLNTPPDGYTVEEKQLEKIITTLTIHEMYRKLPTSRMKFIAAAHFELGYPQDLVAEILGISQPTLVNEIALIQRVLLGKPYKPRRKEGVVKVEDMFQMMLLLQRP